MGHYSLYHFGVVHYQSAMGANFYQAVIAWTTCFVITIVVTLFTRPRNEQELVGLVYSMTARLETTRLPWYDRPGVIAVGVLGLCAILNLIFW